MGSNHDEDGWKRVYAILDGKNGRDQSGANVGWGGREANRKTNRGKVGREAKGPVGDLYM